MTNVYYQDLYQTKDTETAIILYSMKQVLGSVSWENGSCFFIFENKDACERILADYLNDKIKISAKSLMDAARTIKNIIRTGA